MQRFLSEAGPPSDSFDEYSWMWGDAGNKFFGHKAAEEDLLRWSEWKNSAATIRDLEAFKGAKNDERPVEMIGIHSHGHPVALRPNLEDVNDREKMHFETIGEAIDYLGMHRSDYSWMWGDAGTHFLGHRMAEMDPLRWSPWDSRATIIADLEANRNQHNLERPVEIRKDGQSKVTFANLDQAISYLKGSGEAAQAQGAAAQPGAQPGAQAAVAPVPVPVPAPAPMQAVGATLMQVPAPSPSASMASPVPSGSSAESRVYITDSTVELLLTTLVLFALAFCGFLGYCFLKGKLAGQEGSDEDHSDCEALNDASPLKVADAPAQAWGPDASQAGRSTPKGALRSVELRLLLQEIEHEDNDLASPTSARMAALPPSPASRQQAMQEVERILATRDVHGLLGSGTAASQKSEFRRLVRLLHPDKGLVEGERANLALRRIVEYHSLVKPGA